MHYNFDEIIDRRASRSTKWHQYPADVLPMWIADMDFRCPPPITEALHTAVAHGVFGYDFEFADLRATVCERMARLYGWQITPADVVLLPGLVTGFNVAARAFCRAGDGVLVQPPVYPPMLQAAEWHGLQNHLVPLVAQRNGRVLRYEIDFDAFAAGIQPNTRLFLFCHPHNPVGRVWQTNELQQLAEHCLAHNLIICSDEIHCELLLGQRKHTPIATLSPEIAAQTVTLIAPSKTFNMPGLECSFAIITNPQLRQQYQRAAAGLVPHINNLGIAAGVAAYSTATDDWLAALLPYLQANADTAVDFVRTHLPQVSYVIPEATYLAWFDFSAYGLAQSPAQFLLQQGKVALNDGAMFGAGAASFARLNFGCPRATLQDGLARIAHALAAR